MILQAYFFVYLNALIEVWFEFNVFTSIGSYVTASIFFVVMTGSIFSVPIVRLIYRKKLDKLEESGFNELFSGIKTDKWFASQYHFIFALRRILMAIVVVGLLHAPFWPKMLLFFGI